MSNTNTAKNNKNKFTSSTTASSAPTPVYTTASSAPAPVNATASSSGATDPISSWGNLWKEYETEENMDKDIFNFLQPKYFKVPVRVFSTRFQQLTAQVPNLRNSSKANAPTAKSLEEIKTFLKAFNMFLFITEGNPWEKPSTEFIPGTTSIYNDKKKESNDVCNFLGTQATQASGCKVSGLPDKLVVYVQAMSYALIKFFQNITPESRQAMLVDKDTMEHFGAAVRNLLYFYGQKQKSPPLCSEGNVFIILFERLNTLFGKSVIRMACQDKCDYGCGRLVSMGKCANEGYYVLVYKTKGTNSMNAALNITNVYSSESKKCGGGKRKTRRHRSKKGKTKKSKHRHIR